MKLCALRLVAALCVLLAAQVAAAADRFPGTAWERVDPEAAGWSASKLAKAEQWSQRIGSTAVMVVHRGAVVAEWGDTSARTPLASVRKSLLSALIGIAVERGEIDLSRPIGALGIDDNEPSLTAEEKGATVRDLLMSRSGIYHAALYETAAMAAQRPRRGSHKPGSFWYYNNWDFNTLGAIYEHAVRSSIFDAFEREIARPIGMQDYRPSDGEYFTGAASVYPAYPIRMSARDLARFAPALPPQGPLAGSTGRHRPNGWRRARRLTRSPDSVRATATCGGSDRSTAALRPRSSFPKAPFPPRASVVSTPLSSRATTWSSFVAGLTWSGGATYREIGRLLWLLLDAGGFRDIGPDASIGAAWIAPATGETLLRILPGKTLVYGETASQGPYRIRLNADGSAVVLRGREPTELDTGSWSVREDQLCRAWKKLGSQCSAVVSDGSKVQLFDRTGMMTIDGRIVED